mmetsp:Transcript_7234/g.9431  ORF Transcript_7234/g.9431 Transcript_7234/m.9431 type:complete len:131 (-) Transcript_7234:928-1320(-)
MENAFSLVQSGEKILHKKKRKPDPPLSEPDYSNLQSPEPANMKDGTMKMSSRHLLFNMRPCVNLCFEKYECRSSLIFDRINAVLKFITAVEKCLNPPVQRNKQGRRNQVDHRTRRIVPNVSLCCDFEPVY